MSVNSKASINCFPEKIKELSMYVVSIVAYQDYQDRCRTSRNWIFTHVGLSAHAHNIVQEVQVHEWLALVIRTLLLFLTLANK